jgi:hypothetical protein
MNAFTNRSPAPQTKEQRKVSNLAWKPSPIRASMQQSGEAVAVYVSPEAAAKRAAKAAAAEADKAARKQAGIEKRAVTLAAKKAAKSKVKAKA